MTWLRELWCWLMRRGLKQPCALVWVSMHCNVGLVIYMSWHVKFYVGTVSVGCRLNLWRKPNSLSGEALICNKRCQLLCWQTFQLLSQTGSKMSKFKFCLAHCLTWYHAMDGLIFIRSGMLWNHIEWTRLPPGMRGMSSPGAWLVSWRDRDNAIMNIVVIASKHGCTIPRRLL